MITKSQSIKAFLTAVAKPDLAALYNLEMECQVNVAQDGGSPTSGDYYGRIWRGWTDNIQIWKPIRIPRNASTEPEYTDSPIKFDLEAHAEAIGMTGWNWVKKTSAWVAYDFDAISGHSEKHAKKLTEQELEDIKKAVAAIDWVTIRKSTSGRGLHLYVLLPNVPTQNHNEHAALARAILGMLTAITGFEFQSKVDICGGNMWVWHRKMRGTDGLTLIKQGTILQTIPSNWQAHIKVVKKVLRKIKPEFLGDHQEKTSSEQLFDDLTSQRPKVPLDSDHKKLLDYLSERDFYWVFDQDHHMLITHTYYLREAHNDLALRGIFKTNAQGAEAKTDHNCFMFPCRRGGWSVRRYSPGVAEADTWYQDGAGWTSCYFNREPDVGTAARSAEGLEHPSGGFVFRHAEQAVQAASSLGASVSIPNFVASRRATMKQHKDGRLILEIEHDSHDDGGKMMGWLQEKGFWKKIFNIKAESSYEPETGNYDDIVRHLVTESGDDYGWVIKSDEQWRNEPLTHIRPALTSLGFDNKEMGLIVGSSVFKCWTLVNRPFEPEYSGDRQWNRNAAQMRFAPKDRSEIQPCPSWKKILEHIGQSLNAAIESNAWCKANGITSGADYLRVWIASLFKEPSEPLPYIFLYGPQNSGKSILHEALELLVTNGYRRADNALISQQGFNGELENAIICVIEETDLRKNLQAYNRIKDWVTSRLLPIHKKSETPYSIVNTTHWIQCANSHEACPVFPGDSRITMIYVDALSPLELVPKKQLIMQLEKEAPDFLGDILSVEIPPSNDRLNVPVIATDEKGVAEGMNRTMLEQFVKEKVFHRNGYMIKFSDFCEAFHAWLDPNYVHEWSRIKIGRSLPIHFPKGRLSIDNGQVYIGNISFDEKIVADTLHKYVSRDDKLVLVPNA